MYFFKKKMSEMLFNTPVKVHLYLKVYSFHVFLSFYSSLSGIWGEGGAKTSICDLYVESLGSGVRWSWRQRALCSQNGELSSRKKEGNKCPTKTHLSLILERQGSTRTPSEQYGGDFDCYKLYTINSRCAERRQ